jgi:hypothetical protein
MKAQEPCSEHCVGSRHLHLEVDDPKVKVTLVGYGQWEDQYLSIYVGLTQVVIRADELRAMGRGIITEEPK